MEWSIQQVARAAGTTTRTLRYYGEVGLLEPSRIGCNGYRFYDQDALVRLQRILLLRELGLAVPEITRVLAGERDPAAALRLHLQFLESERAGSPVRSRPYRQPFTSWKEVSNSCPPKCSAVSITPGIARR